MPRSPEVCVIGGGVAGLWTLRSLLAQGRDAVLVETRALGHGQTIASQGILHAGTKYALTGAASQASKAVGEAARRWTEGMRADGPIDLSAAAVLSPRTYMFTTPGLASRLGGLAASKALKIGPQKLERSVFPSALVDAPAGVDVYGLDEPVLDTRSLVGCLASPVRDRTLLAVDVSLEWSRDDDGARRATVALHAGACTHSMRPGTVVLTAGAANERLLKDLGLEAEISMQRRPLHMVMARGTGLPPIHAHCVGLSDKPRATITSARDAAGRMVWYIGGQIAETGVERSREDQLLEARDEIGQILPHVDLSGTEWATFTIDRAEGFHLDGKRPDTPVVRSIDNVIACWPTKLVLAPIAADQVLEALGTEPNGDDDAAPIPDLPSPPVATPPWDREDIRWT